MVLEQSKLLQAASVFDNRKATGSPTLGVDVASISTLILKRKEKIDLSSFNCFYASYLRNFKILQGKI